MSDLTIAPAVAPIILGHLVRERRQAAGLSLREMAGRSGISVVDLGKVERGLFAPNDGVLGEMFLVIRSAAMEAAKS